jgi:hypothetical protein
LQYVVAPFVPPLNFSGGGSPAQGFPAALTMVGNNVSFQGPTDANSPFTINGNDQCVANSAVSAIGYTNPGDLQSIVQGTAANPSSYPGVGKTTPSVVNVTGLPQNLQTPSGLDALVQTIAQGADMVINPPPGQLVEETSLPKSTASNPVTVVVKGDFDLGSGANDFGLLVVTGTFSYDADASWHGIILVIGNGTVIANQIGNSTGQFTGAMLVAQTRDSAGNLLPDPNLGPASFNVKGGGLGILYNTCWINAAGSRPLTYQVLSYRQLSQ